MCFDLLRNSITLFYVVYYDGNITGISVASCRRGGGGGDCKVKKRALNITTNVVLQAFSGICGVVWVLKYDTKASIALFAVYFLTAVLVGATCPGAYLGRDGAAARGRPIGTGAMESP